MLVTATEFKTNLGKYLDLLSSEDIYITRHGKTVGKLVNPHVSAVRSLTGLLKGRIPESYDAKSLRDERLKKYALDD